MKKSFNVKNILLSGLLAGLLIFTFNSYVIGQDTVKATSKKSIVRLKIKKDDNGKTTVIDTTFSLANPGSHKELEEYLNKYEADLDELREKLDNLEVTVDMPDFPDSLVSDSAIKQLRFAFKDIKAPHFNLHNRSHRYDYDIEVPPFPESPPPMHRSERFEGDDWVDHHMRTFQYENKRNSLTEILGDIPMDRVKSYSIKEKKNGKRIIIDLNDEPVIEKKDKVIIIREHGRKSRMENQ